MPLPLSALWDLAAAVRDAIETRWPIDAEPLPDRRFVSNGTIVWDCDQLAIGIDSTFGTLGDPAFAAVLSGAQGIGYSLRAASVTALLLRCVPAPEEDDQGNVTAIPTTDEIETSAQLLLSDSIALFNVLLEAQAAGELATCQGLAFDRGQAEGPEGGLGGWSIRVQALML